MKPTEMEMGVGMATDRASSGTPVPQPYESRLCQFLDCLKGTQNMIH